ncbi:MAG TPA: hypothetical protein VGV68_09720 [Terriglobia bacterium]|nr:hypothetical protein [Terriglobia bacterium]
MDPKRADAPYKLVEVFHIQRKEELAQEELKKVTQVHQTDEEKLLHEISGTAPSAPQH